MLCQISVHPGRNLTANRLLPSRFPVPKGEERSEAGHLFQPLCLKTCQPYTVAYLMHRVADEATLVDQEGQPLRSAQEGEHARGNEATAG
jgi:hypothetical protein